MLVGKTNLPPWGGGIETDNEVFGRTSNPYDVARSAGGSSGGAAASVAEGCSALALGTDSGASVRLPAHFCGLAALKPTAGRVPITGVIDDVGPSGPLRDPRTQIGIAGALVADVALVLSVDRGRRRRARRRARRCGSPCSPTTGSRRPTPTPRASWRPPPRALADAGADVSGAAPPGGGHALTQEVWASYGAEAISYDLLGRWDAYRAEHGGASPRRSTSSSPPSYPTPRRATARSPNHTSYTTPQNMSGWAAATVRCGTSADGLPIGVQLSAPPWRDEVALAAAVALERASAATRRRARGPERAGERLSRRARPRRRCCRPRAG